MRYESHSSALCRAYHPQIVASDFPPPPSSLTRSKPQTTGAEASSDDTATQGSASSTDKENAPPLNNNVPLDFFGQAKQPPSPIDIAISLHSDIRHNLENGFKEDPPHTIQRIAELVLRPRRDYRYLPPYLQALNRALSVSSTTKAFPLPNTTIGPQTGAASLLVNGNIDSALGSDESLGGALLTPIPWLTAHSPGSEGDRELHDTAHRLQEQHALHADELPDAPNGLIEEDSTIAGEDHVEITNGDLSPTRSLDAQLRSEGAVSQGELLRLEQEAGVVPVPSRAGPEADSITLDLADHGILGGLHGDSEETPHARGPDEIGAEDIGPQTGSGGIAGILRSSETRASESDTAEHSDTAADGSEGETSMEVDEPTEDDKEAK
jgi:hypothetical protein